MKYVVIIIVSILIFSCKQAKIEKLNDIVSDWVGKEFVGNKNFSSFRDANNFAFSIVSYVDSLGCISCKLQLNKWRKFDKEIDSISEEKVSIIFIAHTSVQKDLKHLFNSYHFSPDLFIIDADNLLNIANGFPQQNEVQTFLLDKNNKVLAIGNPIHNPKVKELYMKIILGEKAPKKKDEIKTIVTSEISLIDFGEFDWKVEQKATFKLKNAGVQPLVILDVTTSCGCISAEYPKEPVSAGKEAEIAVVYKADKAERFNKTITVYCNGENSPIILNVEGIAK